MCMHLNILIHLIHCTQKVHLKCIIHYNLERMFGAPRIHRNPILTPVSEPLCPGLFDLYRMFFPWEKTMKMPTKPISRGYLERGHTDSIAFCSPLGSLNEWPCLEVCGLKAKLLLSSIQLLMGLCCRSFSLFRKRWIFMWNLWWTFKTILKKICLGQPKHKCVLNFSPWTSSMQPLLQCYSKQVPDPGAVRYIPHWNPQRNWEQHWETSKIVEHWLNG